LGNVGIGTPSPSTRLEVDGVISVCRTGYAPTIQINDKRPSGAAWNLYSGYSTLGDFTINESGAGNTPRLCIEAGGNVGIGMTNPEEKLHVSGITRFDLGAGRINMSTPGGWPGMIAYSPNEHRRDIVYDDSGVYINASSTSSPPLSENKARFNEDGTVSVKTLEIRGGSDIAEPFNVKKTDEPKAGMVLSIDSETPGKLKISEKAYDRCVAGIISGAGGINPGMLMSQLGTVADGEYPLALTGRVYCCADASNGPIEPGDLLTTSDTPGRAMKVTDYTKAQGAILGKAMSSLTSGRGLVLVLVTLQ
jgi:hypothetical protein